MKIQTKLTLGTCALIVVALIATSFAVSYVAGKQSSETLEALTYQELHSLTDLTGENLSSYFDGVEGFIRLTSSDPTIVAFAKRFISTSPNYAGDARLPDEEEQIATIRSYYENEFGKEYSRINGKQAKVDDLISQLDKNGLAFQYQFIANNEHPLGNKDLLDQAPKDTSLYALQHNKFHPYARDLLNHFGYDDIYIAEIKTGNVIYSVKKEIEFGTSLINGAFANSGIGEAFAQAAQTEDPTYVHLSDFTFYTPAYGAPTAFVSSPMYDRGKKIGVLIFKISNDEINKIMTHRNNWEAVGLAMTGETVVVGQDNLLRSVSRNLIQKKADFLSLLESQSLVGDQALQQIGQLGTNVMLQSIDNPAIRDALTGGEGEMRYTKYTGEEVLASYKPIEVIGQQWVVLSEIDIAEAFLPTEQLISKINHTVVTLSVVITIICIALALTFSKIIIRPLQRILLLVNDLASGDGDLSKRIENKSIDETGELADSINVFITKIQTLVRNINTEAESLNQITQTMEDVSSKNTQGAKKQQNMALEVDKSIEQMQKAANESADSASSAEAAASEVMEATNKGADVMSLTTQTIEDVAENVEQAVKIIQQLEQSSDSIGSVVGVISGIAEQTNLLALNAAIEAARAGDQGRGFAVVADEVRALASRTQESTVEINSIVEKLQDNANAAVSAMNTGNESVGVCVKEVANAQQTLDEIQQKVADINEMNLRIASSAEQQREISTSVKGSIEQITEVSGDNTKGAATATEQMQHMSLSIRSLRNSIGQFKIDS